MTRITPETETPSDRSRRFRVALFSAVVVAVTLGHAGSALAQDRARAGGGALGVGVSAMLTGPVGPTIVYDAGAFHVEGIFGFASNGATEFDLGGRFWYHVNSASAADFSLGGGVGVTTIDPDGPAEGETNIHFDVGAQVRMFLVPNVAVMAAAGLGIVSGEDDDTGEENDLIIVRGDLIGSAGLAYFF